MRNSHSTAVLALACLIVAAPACGKKKDIADAALIAESPSQIAASALTGAVNASDLSATSAFAWLNAPASPSLATFGRFASLWESSALAAGTPGSCTGFLRALSNSCVASAATPPVVTLAMDGCVRRGGSWIRTGNETYRFATGATCPPQVNGNVVVRTFDLGATEMSLDRSVTVQLDTANAARSGWDSSVANVGSGVSTYYDSTFTASGGRTVTINGIHLSALLNAQKLAWDMTVSSGQMFVSGFAQQRVVRSGAKITVQHNVQKYTAVATVTRDLTYLPKDPLDRTVCRYPLSGEISTEFTGSRKDAEKLTFQEPCGSVVVQTGKASKSATLIHDF